VKNGGFYVDVGANDPKEDSVTKLFYDREWHGINIEPSSDAFTQLQASRPRDINLLCAAGEREGEVTFFETNIRGWGTSNTRVGEDYVQRKLASPCTVQMRTLNSVLEQHAKKTIHFLKIDVEGAEDTVLAGLDLIRFRPWILLVETIDPLTHENRSSELEGSILKANYKRVFFDGLNTYYLAAERSNLEKNFNAPPNVLDEFSHYSLVKSQWAIDDCARLEAEKRDALARIEELEAEREDALALLAQSLMRGGKANIFAGVLAYTVNLIFNRSSKLFRKYV
jgi:FkbM family methyltransferase